MSEFRGKLKSKKNSACESSGVRGASCALSTDLKAMPISISGGGSNPQSYIESDCHGVGERGERGERGAHALVDSCSPSNLGEGSSSHPQCLGVITSASTNTVMPDAEIVKKANIHIILLIHLSRCGDDGDGKYCVDFDTRWKFAFVDSVQPADSLGLPDVEAMIGRTLHSLVADLDLRKVLLRCFRQSLSRLSYPYQRANDGVREQIGDCMKCFENRRFLDLAGQTIHSLLSESTDRDTDVSTASLDERELQLAGTFQSALHMKILSTISSLFAHFMAHIDRNSNMRLVTLPQWTDAWIDLFKMSFNADLVNTRMRSSTVVRVVGDGMLGAPFKARFPFSPYIESIISSMRTANEFSSNLKLQLQFEVVGLPPLISGQLGTNSVLAPH